MIANIPLAPPLTTPAPATMSEESTPIPAKTHEAIAIAKRSPGVRRASGC